MNDDEQIFDLKPCPFCGGAGELTDMGDDYVTNEPYWAIVCGSCCAETDHYISRLQAVKAWNRRGEAQE